jgi:hypothetical protein
MPTYIEALPATKSSKYNGIRWTTDTVQTDSPAAAGVMQIDTARGRTVYKVVEFGTGWDGRAFHFSKISGGTDAESEAYDVFVCRSGGAHQCDCKGFAYNRGKPCKHIESILALIENRWI